MRSAGVGRPTDIYDLKVRVRMSQEMMDKTCRGFAEALAAREPVPGGGSASALWARWAPRCAEWLPATVRPIPRLLIVRMT